MTKDELLHEWMGGRLRVARYERFVGRFGPKGQPFRRVIFTNGTSMMVPQ